MAQSRRIERLGGLPGVSQLIVVAVAVQKKQNGKNEKLLQAVAWAWKWFFVSLAPTPTTTTTHRAFSFPEFSERWTWGVGFVLRFAEDELTNAETYRMPSIIVH